MLLRLTIYFLVSEIRHVSRIKDECFIMLLFGPISLLDCLQGSLMKLPYFGDDSIQTVILELLIMEYTFGFSML